MEGLAPSLKCLVEMRSAVQNGDPARAGLAHYIETARSEDDFAPFARRFLFAWDQGHDWRAIVRSVRGAHRRALLELAATAMAGQPILAHLEELRGEIESAAEVEIAEHMEILPVRMLIPLLLFQFPAFLLLMFGPLLRQLVAEIAR